MEKNDILLIAASKSDPSRLEVQLNDFTQILTGFNLSILEINFPGEVVFFTPGVDYIEVQQIKTNENRNKRSLKTSNQIYQTKPQQKQKLLDITPIEISNFFPWIFKYQKSQLLSHGNVLEVLFHPRFSISKLSELLGVTYTEAAMKHLGVISFCMNLKYIKKGKLRSIWPKDIKSETLEMIGFKPREKSDRKTAQLFFRYSSNKMGIDVWPTWYSGLENLFNNKVEESVKTMGISTWDFIAKMNNIISEYYKFLNYESNIDQNPAVNRSPLGQTTSSKKIQKTEIWTVSKRKRRSLQLSETNTGHNSENNLQPGLAVTRQGEDHSINISEIQPSTTLQPSISETPTHDGKYPTYVRPQPENISENSRKLETRISPQSSSALHFGIGTRQFFSCDAITDFLNDNSNFLSTAIFDEISQKLTIKVSEKEKIILHGKMPEVLSLPRIMNGSNTYVSSHCVDPYINNRIHYIYCDISEHIVLGENYAPVVQIFSTLHEGKNHTSFQTPIFIPIARKNLRKINLVIYNEIGEKIKFITSQPSTAKILLSEYGGRRDRKI